MYSLPDCDRLMSGVRCHLLAFYLELRNFRRHRQLWLISDPIFLIVSTKNNLSLVLLTSLFCWHLTTGSWFLLFYSRVWQGFAHTSAASLRSRLLNLLYQGDMTNILFHQPELQFGVIRWWKSSLSSSFKVGGTPFSHDWLSGVIRIGLPVWRWKRWNNFKMWEVQRAANGPVWMFQALEVPCFIQFWSWRNPLFPLLALWGNKNWPPSMKVKKME